MQTSLLFFYGLCAWGAALNFPAWAMLLMRRWQVADREPWWRDVLMLVRAGLSLLSFGVAGLAGTRIVADLTGGAVLTLPNTIAIAFIACMAMAEPVFLRVDEIHARARGRFSWSWRIYWAGALVWGAAVILVA